jgi:phosphate transport system ATP-binding protein
MAKTLAQNPKVLLIDEPLSRLEVTKDLVRSLKRDYTIVFATSSVSDAREVADFVAFFHRGQLREHDTSAKVFVSPEEEMTHRYLSGALTH